MESSSISPWYYDILLKIIWTQLSATIDLFSLRKTSSVAMVDCLVVELNNEET